MSCSKFYPLLGCVQFLLAPPQGPQIALQLSPHFLVSLLLSCCHCNKSPHPQWPKITVLTLSVLEISSPKSFCLWSSPEFDKEIPAGGSGETISFLDFFRFHGCLCSFGLGWLPPSSERVTPVPESTVRPPPLIPTLPASFL